MPTTPAVVCSPGPQTDRDGLSTSGDAAQRDGLRQTLTLRKACRIFFPTMQLDQIHNAALRQQIERKLAEMDAAGHTPTPPAPPPPPAPIPAPKPETPIPGRRKRVGRALLPKPPDIHAPLKDAPQRVPAPSPDGYRYFVKCSTTRSFRSANEARFYRQFLHGNGLYESIHFLLHGGRTYTPDFTTVSPEGRLTCYEVKDGFDLPSLQRSKLAFDCAREMYPLVEFRWFVYDSRSKTYVEKTFD